jgi:hypothetical protein
VVDDLLEDYRDKSNTDGVFVGRVLRRMGCGRMEVFYVYKKYNEFEGDHKEDRTQIMPMCGALRGKGKKNVWVDPGSLVIVVETGLAGTTHEIRAVFSPEQVARRFGPEARATTEGTREALPEIEAAFEVALAAGRPRWIEALGIALGHAHARAEILQGVPGNLDRRGFTSGGHLEACSRQTRR